MDPVSHCLMGRVLHSFSGPRLPPGRQAAFVLGSLAPDADIVTAAAGWDRYLRLHEIGTHTLALSPLVAWAVAAAIAAVMRGTRAQDLWRPAWAGVVGHILLDVVSGSDTRLLAPLWGIRVGPHWLAMGDWLALGVLAVGALGTRRRPRLAAALTMLTLAGLLGLKALSQHLALRAFTAAGHQSIGHPEAVSGSLSQWTVFAGAADGTLGVWRVNGWTGALNHQFSRHEALEDPLVRQSTAAPVVQALRDLAHAPFARVESRGETRLVLWSDLRHCGAKSCALSFGIETDAAGRALRQIIQIGPVEQTRPVW